MNIELEKLRLYNESDRHWFVRKRFLTHNWENVEASRLNSLSLCWTNNLFDGNRYPLEVQKIVAQLTCGMASVETILNEVEQQTQKTFMGRKRRISQERDQTISVSTEKDS